MNVLGCGRMKDYGRPPTPEFARTRWRDIPKLNQWHMMLKCVLNDYWFDTNDDNWLDDSSQVDHFMHKLYYCWMKMGEDMYGEEE